MPHSKQAEKRVRQNLKRRLENRAQKSKVKTFRKRFFQACDEGDKGKAQEVFVSIQALIDKAAKTRIIHPNKAGRDKARLAARLNKLQG